MATLRRAVGEMSPRALKGWIARRHVCVATNGATGAASVCGDAEPTPWRSRADRVGSGPCRFPLRHDEDTGHEEAEAGGEHGAKGARGPLERTRGGQKRPKRTGARPRLPPRRAKRPPARSAGCRRQGSGPVGWERRRAARCRARRTTAWPPKWRLRRVAAIDMAGLRVTANPAEPEPKWLRGRSEARAHAGHGPLSHPHISPPPRAGAS